MNPTESQTTQDKIGFMQGLTKSLLDQQRPQDEIQATQIEQAMPQTLGEALQIIQQQQEEIMVLREQLQQLPAPGTNAPNEEMAQQAQTLVQ